MSDAEGEWLEAVESTREALKADPTNVALLFKQGQAYFHLEEFESAIAVLQTARGIAAAAAAATTEEEDKALVKKIEMWIRKCNTHLSPDKQIHVELKGEAAAASSQAAPAAPVAPAAAPAAAVPPPPPPDAGPKVRLEWFQSPTHVGVTLFCKDRSESDVAVEYAASSVGVTIQLGGGKEYQHTLSPLYGEVVPAECKHVVGKYKVEISLRKATELQWRALERTPTDHPAPAPAAAPAAPAAPARPAYPSSRPQKKDWDRLTADLTAEEANEKEEGDAALNKLFRDIYSRADENTRRAMNKSFVESGGTVLSTNWSEVGAKHVDGTPPTGMEFKKLGE